MLRFMGCQAMSIRTPGSSRESVCDVQEVEFGNMLHPNQGRMQLCFEALVAEPPCVCAVIKQ